MSGWIESQKVLSASDKRSRESDDDEEVPRRRLKRLRLAANSDEENENPKNVETPPPPPSQEAEEEEEEDEDKIGESDYLEFRRVTSNIKDLIVEQLGGSEEEHRQEIGEQIQRGRCSFVRSYNPPPVILEDNPTLKPYQVAAVHWLLTLYKNKLNGLVADDMGLGKSAEAICFLQRLFADGLIDTPAVVACPTTLLDNWCDEFRKWAPKLRVLKYHGSQKERRSLWYKFSTGMSEDEEDEEEEEEEEEEEAETTAGSGSPDEASTSNAPHDEEEVEEESYPLPARGDCAYHVLVTTHQTLAGHFDRQRFFKSRNFGYLVVDEAHSLKNSNSQRYQQMNKSINASGRLLMTGSPVQNQISELKNLLAFLHPYRKITFNTDLALQYHTRVWNRALEEDRHKRSPNSPTPSQNADPEVLFYQQLLAPLILRRLKVEVIENFPRKTNKIELCDMVQAQQEMYDAEIRQARPQLLNVNGPKRRKPRAQSQTFIRGLLFRLRRICNHPIMHQRYFDDNRRREFATYMQQHNPDFNQPLDTVIEQVKEFSDFDIHCCSGPFLPATEKFRLPPEEFLNACKIRRMLELLDELCIEKDQKVLIFSQFTTFLDVIQETLCLHRPQLAFLRLDGSTAASDRSTMVSKFQQSGSAFKIFLLSTKAGGVGLNLTSARTVLLMDQDWNPHNDRQAEDRVHRLGQTDDVTVFRLCCRYSFEETILSCCKKKLELDEAFGGSSEALPLELFEDMIRTVKTAAEEEQTPPPASSAPTESSTSSKSKAPTTKSTPRTSKGESDVPKRRKTTAAPRARQTKQSPPPCEDARKKTSNQFLLPGGDSDEDEM